jgi:hypothetical protein
VLVSSALTVGSPDANGMPANSTGFALLNSIVGNPATPDDEADVSLAFTLTDVRARPALLDYSGDLQFRPEFRLTDREGAGGPTATLQDVVLPVAVPCTVTLDPASGAICSLATTLDALTPGLVKEGARAVWQLRSAEVRDADDHVFARPGLFIP